MSATSELVDEMSGTIYQVLREDEPLSVPEILETIREQRELDIDCPREVDQQTVKVALKRLVREGHVTHDSSVDSEGQVKWRTTTRPDLNPKPDGSEVSLREMILDAK